MDLERKLELLGQAARFDVCMAPCAGGRKRLTPYRWVYPAVTPDGKVVKLLKVLMHGECRYGCRYCGNRGGLGAGVSFGVDELARVFLSMWRAGLVNGLFLSSAVGGEPDDVMGQMVGVVERIRREGFGGYVHLKVLPGASEGSVEAAARVADRLSVNLEAPGQKALSKIAPQKSFKHLRRDLVTVTRVLRSRRLSARTITTQFMVGPGGETDLELIRCAEGLIRGLSLARVYFSAFTPIPSTPLEDAEPTPLTREVRLYQAEFLIRLYGFSASEIVFEGGMLRQDVDVKLATALAHPEWFPVDVNSADFRTLLRVPGIGLRSARRIVAARKEARLRGLSDLAALGTVAERAAPFVLFSGKRPLHTPSLFGGGAGRRSAAL